MTVASGPISIICGYNAYGYVRPCLIDEDGALVVSGGSSDMDASDVTYTPTTPADWDGGIDPGNQNDANDQLAERVKDLETALAAIKYPNTFSAMANILMVSDGNAITKNYNTSQYLSTFWYQNPSALNDATYFECFLRAGDYTLSLHSITGNTRGIITASYQYQAEGISHNFETTMDFYSAVTTFNVSKSCNVTLPSNGLYRITLTVASKNASSSGYMASFSMIDIKPQ